MSFIQGNILIFGKTGSFSGGTAHIYLEDTSRADAPAKLIAEMRIENITHSQKEINTATVISFRLEYNEKRINPKQIYSLRVWIDTHHTGSPNEQDLFSDEFYPVLTHGVGDYVEIRLGSSG